MQEMTTWFNLFHRFLCNEMLKIKTIYYLTRVYHVDNIVIY